MSAPLRATEVFDAQANAQVVAAIQAAELRTSGEVRVYVEDTTGGADPMERAWRHFQRLKMDQTAARNGVLIYLAVVDRKFAVVGDQGIHSHVPPRFWADVRDAMRGHFKEGRFVEGISAAVTTVGEQLAAWFPRQDDDVNELPDDIIFGSNAH